MNKWTRRAFISAGVVVGGGILVGVAMRPGNRVAGLQEAVADDGETLVHAFIKIDQDNVVTVISPHAEMGQGAQTALAQMAAEELDADWDKVRIEEAPALSDYTTYTLGRGYLLKDVPLPGAVIPTIDGVMMRVTNALNAQITGGSLSIRATGQYGMRVAGAATKDMLKQAAADAWNVPFDQIETEKSMLHHRASSRSAPYATFATAAAEMTPSYTPELKGMGDFSIIGQSVERQDIPGKVDGTAPFALDVRVPGMVYATTRRAPVFGGTVVRIDDAEARQMTGVIDVITLPSDASEGMLGGYEPTGETVAVIADSYWTASQALQALTIEWDSKGRDSVTSETIYAKHAQDLTSGAGRESDLSQGDIEAAFDAAATVIEAEYRVPYLAHTAMEPLNATADVNGSSAEIWVGCQNPLGFRRKIATALDLNEEQVTLNNTFMGGGFGRKSIPDWAVQAALISKAGGKPVQLIWSREEDVRQDFYRPSSTSRFRAALDDSGIPQGWQNTYVNKQEPVEAPLIPYTVAAKDIGYIQSPSHVPWGAWRSVDESQQGFFTESFIDECAHAAGQDPYEYRAAMLSDHPRMKAVLDKAAEAADWGTPLGEGRGRGIAVKESFGSIVAEVIEVTMINGDVRVDRVVAAIDAGVAITPDGLKAQVESGIIYALTAAIHGEITIEDGAVAQGNFYDYEALRMSTAPRIETHIINSGHDIGGAGEPGTPPAAAALANAIFAATGTRARQLPLAKDVGFYV